MSSIDDPALQALAAPLFDLLAADCVTGQPPFPPSMRCGVEHADLSRIPLADPDASFRIGPHSPRALLRRRRIDDLRRAAHRIDAAEIAARQGREIHAAVGRDTDAVRAGTTRRIEYAHVAACRIELAVDAALPREPEMAALIEDRRVQIRVAPVLGQGKAPDRECLRIDAHDRVQPAVRDPCRPILTDDDAVRCRAVAERDAIGLAVTRVQPSDCALRLRGVPDGAVGRRSDVVRCAAGGNGERIERWGLGVCRTQCEYRDNESRREIPDDPGCDASVHSCRCLHVGS